MTVITATMVAALRAKTDAPMMECKKALTEAAGDMARAEEILRAKLGSKAARAAHRITAEGVVAAYTANHLGALLEVNCETDFVAKNPDFLAFANACARLIAENNPADLAALSALPFSEAVTVEEQRAILVGRIGENLTLRRFRRFETPHQLAVYLHGTRIGVMLEFAGTQQQVGQDVAMHIAAMKPLALSADQVPEALIATERAVAQRKAQDSGKPAEIAEKMVQGSIQKFLKEVSLLNQAFVKNDAQSIEEMLKATQTRVMDFALYVVGEGIEKKAEDFAAEVAATVAASTQ